MCFSVSSISNATFKWYYSVGFLVAHANYVSQLFDTIRVFLCQSQQNSCVKGIDKQIDNKWQNIKKNKRINVLVYGFALQDQTMAAKQTNGKIIE